MTTLPKTLKNHNSIYFKYTDAAIIYFLEGMALFSTRLQCCLALISISALNTVYGVCRLEFTFHIFFKFSIFNLYTYFLLIQCVFSFSTLATLENQVVLYYVSTRRTVFVSIVVIIVVTMFYNILEFIFNFFL